MDAKRLTLIHFIKNFKKKNEPLFGENRKYNTEVCLTITFIDLYQG